MKSIKSIQYRSNGVEMRIIEALGALQFLTKKLISLSDIAEALGKTKGAINNRHNMVGGRSDELKPDEIKQLEIYFNVDIENFVKKNSGPNATQNTQDKKELAKLIKETITEMILEKGGQELYNKFFK